MAGFANYNAYINALTVLKQRKKVPVIRTINTGATSAAGRWHETMSPAAGTGGAMTLTGTAGTGIVMNGSTAGRIPIGADVGGAMTRHLTGMTVYTPSTVLAPGCAMLTDIIHIYPSLVMVTTPSTLSNHPTWTGSGDTRMTSADGVQASMLLTTASSAAGQVTLTYLDQAGNSQAQSGSLFGPVAAHPAGAFMGQVPVTATPGPVEMALATGDTGVQRVSSYAINTGATGGVGCIMLHRPIATVPILAANQPTAWDFTQGSDAFPRVYDDACLALIVNIGGALTVNQVLKADLDLAWG
jgi:hypothetical protein